MTEQLMGYREAAGHLGVKLGTLYSWVSARRIPHIRFGNRCVRFDISELNAWVDSHRLSTPGELAGGRDEEADE